MSFHLFRGKAAPLILPEADTLATHFIAVLREWLTYDERWRVISRNARETDSSVCHSHDFCDANEAMERAFHLAGWKDVDTSDEHVCARFNEAWALAQARFYTELW